MIESLQANTDILRFHVPTDAKEPAFHRRGGSKLSNQKRASPTAYRRASRTSYF
jgi:hypothetical protein